MNRIEQALTKMFDRQRIIFWYDTKRELRSDFEQLVIPEVKKIKIRNNEFGTKCRVREFHNACLIG